MINLTPGRRGSLIRWGIAAAFALAMLSQWWPGHVERAIAPEELRAAGGHAFAIEPLRLSTPYFFRVDSDMPGLPSASELVVLEDGRPLGAAHAPGEVIELQGRGAYSHWNDSLFLSSTDGTDPRTNGRRYTVKAPLVARQRTLAISVLVLLFALFGVLRSGAPRAIMLAFHGIEKLAAADPLSGARVAVLIALAAVGAYFAFAALLDPVGALAAARKLAIRLTMAGVWAAAGAVATVLFYRRDARSWRLIVAELALVATAVFLYLRAELYSGDRMLPSGPSVFIPVFAGAVGALAFRGNRIRQRYAELFAAPGRSGPVLATAIFAVLCLAAPMIWSPVVENWNASGWMDSHSYDTYAHNILTGKIPEGSSQYMPVYQYGLAAVYYFFGHFFFAQQLVNVALAFLTVALICLSAWNLFRNIWAVLLIGVWMAFARQFVYAVFFTQIESWYLPIMAFGIFAWTSYWRTPSRSHLLLIALAAAIGINTRNQGAFYFGWLCLAPLFFAGAPWRRRVTHTAIAVTILAASLIPWSLRNYVVDGRLSPSSARNAIYVAILNDPRIGFYGVRYWEGWGEITDDYARRYPDPVERDRAMIRAGLSTPFTDFAWFQRAMYWRTLAFYGLLPAGIFDAEGPRATNWSTEWSGFVYWRTVPLMLLPLSLLGLLTRPGRTTVFLFGAIVANVAISALTGGAEDRVSYPVLPLHMLLGLAAIFPLRPDGSGWQAPAAVLRTARGRTWVAAAACLLVLAVVARAQFGRPNVYAPHPEQAVSVIDDVALDPALPLLNDFAATSKPSPPAPQWQDQTVRLRLMVMNYQCPPKYGGRIGYMPAFATEPLGPTYYYASLIVQRTDRVEHLPIGVTWFGATINEPLREGDEVEAEGRLMLAAGSPLATYWIRIEKARKVAVRSTAIPPFF